MAFKKTTLAVIALAMLALGWSYSTYPRVGQLTYDLVSNTEARLYGLHKQVILVDGIPTTVYLSNGTGPAILMVHGFSADKDVWVRFARHFASTNKVIIPDLPGHGETGFKPEWHYSIPAQTEHLVKLMDQLHVQQAHVIGNSMGGYITARMAVDHPQRMLSATMVDAAGLPQPHPSEMQQMLASGHNPFLFETREAFYRFYPMTMAAPPFMPGFVLDGVADRYVARRAELQRIFNDSYHMGDLAERLPGVTMPTMVLWGKEDRLIDVSSVAVWQTVLPKAKVEIWDGIGHMPMVERPSQAAQLYQQFLTSH